MVLHCLQQSLPRSSAKKHLGLLVWVLFLLRELVSFLCLPEAHAYHHQAYRTPSLPFQASQTLTFCWLLQSLPSECIAASRLAPAVAHALRMHASKALQSLQNMPSANRPGAHCLARVNLVWWSLAGFNLLQSLALDCSQSSKLPSTISPLQHSCWRAFNPEVNCSPSPCTVYLKTYIYSHSSFGCASYMYCISVYISETSNFRCQFQPCIGSRAMFSQGRKFQ